MNLAKKILYLRKREGMSQEELAEKLNISRQSVSRWEVGTAQPDASNILQLSKIFDVTTDYLLHEEYESDEDIPRVKEAQVNFDDQKRRYKILVLIAAISFTIATVTFWMSTVCYDLTQNYMLAILNAVSAVLSYYRLFKLNKKIS
ncbi:helix-turn-helix domain-containing protein [Anaerosporobacter faecicola]|uniref:helix-turn-helix domain-containing protein n=1 Tax=Anaerosporobacter faecicola TaxID=2718714 RepID=UPI00143B0FA3|nr:helix-turn-helix transcriptional regulator [Anaerosporobacter faecicola]